MKQLYIKYLFLFFYINLPTFIDEEPKNEIIYHIEDIPQAIGIVKEGSVVIETVDFLGNVSLLSHIGPNQMFAESYALTKTPMHVYVRAVEDCTIQFLDVQALEKSPELKDQMIQILSNKNKMLSQHIFHISNKTIRNKVLSYLSFMKLETQNSTFKIPFDRQQMADYLNVERSALSKELSKMKSEGLIDYHKNTFTVYSI